MNESREEELEKIEENYHNIQNHWDPEDGLLNLPKPPRIKQLFVDTDQSTPLVHQTFRRNQNSHANNVLNPPIHPLSLPLIRSMPQFMVS